MVWNLTNYEKVIVHLHWFVKTIQWFLPLTRCHFQPLVTFGHSWLEMAPREGQKPFHFLHTSDGKQILIFQWLILPPFENGNLMPSHSKGTVPSIFLIHFTSKWYKPNNHSLSLSSHQEKWRKGRESVLDWSVSRKWNLYQDKLRYCIYRGLESWHFEMHLFLENAC